MAKFKRIKKFKHKNGISFVTALLLVFVLFLAVLGYTQFLDLNEQRTRLQKEHEALLEEKAALEEDLKRIRREANNINDEVYVQSVARQQLDMVYPGEIVFRTSGE